MADTAIAIKERKTATVVFNPERDITRAKKAADQLIDIVKQNKWAVRIGPSEHLKYEAWQTLGKFYNLAVDTNEKDPKYVEFGPTWGFEAYARVIDTTTGLRIGGASALCLSDEPNWKNKPKFQLQSMAQTRAGSKSLRQLLAFVVALAGYNPTPAEEMTTPIQEGKIVDVTPPVTAKPAPEQPLMSYKQQSMIFSLLTQKGKTKQELDEYIAGRFKKDSITKLTVFEATLTIEKLLTFSDATVAEDIDEPEVKLEDIPDNLGATK